MKRNILALLMFVVTLLAAVLGWYAQHMAHYFHDHILYIPRFITLILVTTISISLFVISFITNIKLLGNRKDVPIYYNILLVVNGFIGLFGSYLFLVVVMFWWE